ncbi:MAG: hypothetical protein ACYCP0_07625 [Acidiferrobacteraceae bacterium]
MIAAAGVIWALVFTAHRVFNRRTQRLTPSDPCETKRDGIGSQAVWQFSFVNSAPELLKAERAERHGRSGMNTFFRSVVILMGFVWIVLPFLAIKRDTVLWRPVLSVLVGLAVLRSFLLKPFLVRWKI